MSNRRQNYEARVADWAQANGPEFNLRRVDHIDTDDVDCQACGRRAIRNLFVVNNMANDEFIVGSECQALVLTNPEALAKLPARHIRRRSIEELVMLGALFGLNLSLTQPVGLAAHAVLKARKRDASRRAWTARKANKQTQASP